MRKLYLNLFTEGNWIAGRDVTGFEQDLDSNPEDTESGTAVEQTPRHMRYKRSTEETDMVAVPWQTLWLLQATKSNCGFQEMIMRLGNYPRDLQVD